MYVTTAPAVIETDPLGQTLIELGILTEENLTQALQSRTNGTVNDKLSDVVIRLGMATETQVIKAMGVRDRIPYFEDLEPFISAATANTLPENFCRKFLLAPLYRHGEHLLVAMVNPYDLFIHDEIVRRTGTPIQPVLTTRKAIFAAIKKLYSAGEAAMMTSTVSDAQIEMEAAGETSEYTNFEALAVSAVDEGDSTAQVDMAPVIKLVNQILLDAVNKKVSDIHVEPRTDKLSIRYRLDGILQESMVLPRSLSSAVSSRLKIISKLDISETRRPQDGRIQLKLSDRFVDVRISTMPSVTGEKVVLRILDRDEKLNDLESSGMRGEVLEQFKLSVQQPHGMVLVTGPTGSGKTSTLYAALKLISDGTKNISTLEDPVEYQMDGITQVSINHQIGMTFAAGLRSMLRQDPDVILVGEVRDIETAQISIQAALTGHLVLSTLHTNDACGAVSRMLDMGVEPFLLGTALKGVLALRLVRLLCTYCKKPGKAEGAIMKRLGLDSGDLPSTLYAPVGCEKCNRTGYRRRIGVFEFLPMRPEIQEKVFARATDREILEVARKFGFKTLFERGLEKVRSGETSPEEILRVAVMPDL